MATVQKHVFDILNAYKSDSKLGRYFDYFISTLIVLNVCAILLASYEEVQAHLHVFFNVFETLSVFIFSFEYLLRLWSSPLLYPEKSAWKARIQFVFSFYGLVDLLAVLPFFLPVLVHLDLRFMRALRLLRLARLFKLNRHSSNVRMLGDILQEKNRDFYAVLSAVLIILVISASLMYTIEKEVQPDVFPNIGSAFWWALATLTTIGYGDIVPLTIWGRFLSGIIAFCGIAIVALPTGILSAAFTEKINAQKEADKDESLSSKKYCPHCGEKLE